MYQEHRAGEHEHRTEGLKGQESWEVLRSLMQGKWGSLLSLKNLRMDSNGSLKTNLLESKSITPPSRDR